MERFDRNVIELFQSYQWPGNLREMKNTIKRSVLLTKENEQQIVEIAHKMSPMLKQIEAFSISTILDELEDRKYDDDWDVITAKAEEACDKTHHLMTLLQNEIA